MKEPKNKKIEAKCTETELAKVQQMASENNMSIAEFIRARVLFEEAPKYTLFELRAIKILSASAAWLQMQADELPDEKFEKFHSLLKKIERKNDIRDVIDLDDKDSTENHQ